MRARDLSLELLCQKLVTGRLLGTQAPPTELLLWKLNSLERNGVSPRTL